MKNLKKLIQYKGYTQSELADKLNITEATVSRWINGKVEPSTRNLRKMSKLLGVEIKELLEEAKSERD